jgi:hypothetical protein
MRSHHPLFSLPRHSTFHYSPTLVRPGPNIWTFRPISRRARTTHPLPTAAIYITASLEQFQIDEQRHVLDTVAHIRKCGPEGVL